MATTCGTGHSNGPRILELLEGQIFVWGIFRLGDVNMYSQYQEMLYLCSRVDFLFCRMSRTRFFPKMLCPNVVSKVTQKGRLRCASG